MTRIKGHRMLTCAIRHGAVQRSGFLLIGVTRLPPAVALLVALAVAVPLLTGPVQVQAAEWNAQLQGGGQVTVDPRTNRATVRRNGVDTQLWDGVHRLQDGSIIIINSGQIVPNRGVLEARQLPDQPRVEEEWVGSPIAGYSPCERLARRVCGTDQECSGQPACPPALQLLEMETQERQANDSPNRMTYTSGQCQQADLDRVFFATCGQGPAGSDASALPPATTRAAPTYTPPSSCELLVEKVCGPGGGCSADAACDAARQLLRLAMEESATRKASAVPQSNATDQQCVEALADEEFFQRCLR